MFTVIFDYFSDLSTLFAVIDLARKAYHFIIACSADKATSDTDSTGDKPDETGAE